MEPEKKSSGAFVGLVIIILILVIGGIYMWMSNEEKLEVQENQTQEQAGALNDQDANALDALEQDANDVDVNTGVDVEAVN